VIAAVFAGDPILSPSQVMIANDNVASGGDNSVFSRTLNSNIFRGTHGNANTSLFLACIVLDETDMTLRLFWEVQAQKNKLARPMAKTSSSQS
jgi:hypothetical protein